MICFYLLWTLCYIVLLNWFAGKWPNKTPKVDSVCNFPSVTLLIPVRNESENLDTLFRELRKIIYPKLQILLIDDQSEDGSFSILEEKSTKDLRVKSLQSPGRGKKHALEFGVENANSELIICSDADCRFSEDWIKKMVNSFSDSNVQLVCGPVMTENQDTFFQRFQQIEWASILLLTQFFFQRGKPLMCSGANLSYRKSAFLTVKGYDQNREHLSGDDEFLLKKVSAHFGKDSCVYLPYQEQLVFTKPQPHWAALLSQRVRWAGKWRMHGNFAHVFSAVISVLIQLIWFASLILLGYKLYGFLTFSVVWIGKVWTEKATLGKVLRKLGLSLSDLDFIKTGLLHPFYMLWVAVGALQGKFVWKGREN